MGSGVSIPDAAQGSERPSLRRGRLLAVTVLTAVAVVGLAVVLPEELRFLALVGAFAAGIALERFRHSYFPTPPTLRETPEAWRYVLRYEVGFGQLAIAGVLLAAAAAILFVSFDSRDDAQPAAPSAEVPSAGPMPDLAIRRETSGEEFTADGVAFRVLERPAPAAPAADVAGDGERALAITVAIRNLSRKDFNPAILDYRLRGANRSLFAPERSTATGSDSLVSLGRLPQGETVDQELVFAVPARATALSLEFEPALNAPTVVRVPLSG